MKTEFDAYLRYEELTRTLRALAEEYPKLCRVRSIGKSYEGREIWLAELTNSETGPAEHETGLLGRRQHPRRRGHRLDGGALPDRTPPRKPRLGRPRNPPPRRTGLLRPPPPLPRRRRTLPHDPPYPEGDPTTLARAGRGARPPARRRGRRRQHRADARRGRERRVARLRRGREAHGPPRPRRGRP